MRAKKIVISPKVDKQGKLVVLEESRNIPFPVKRVYYLYDMSEKARRGVHAHKRLRQILVCIHGSCKVRLDDGKESWVVPLDEPYEGLYLPSAVWREIYDFSADTVLLVLASDLYDPSDYITDYEEFVKYVRTCGNRESEEQT